MDMLGEKVGAKDNGEVGSGTQWGNWLELRGDSGFILLSGSNLVKCDKWVLDPVDIVNVHERPHPSSRILSAKSSGSVVLAARHPRSPWLRLAYEPGFILMRPERGTMNIVKVSPSSFVQGLLDTEAAYT